MVVSSTATTSLSSIVVSHNFYGMLMQMLLMLFLRRSKINMGGRVEGLGELDLLCLQIKARQAKAATV
jgi:hypothetical protein